MNKWESEVKKYYNTLSSKPQKYEEGYISQENHIPLNIKKCIQDKSFIIQIIKLPMNFGNHLTTY
jgi:hypothetical protein